MFGSVNPDQIALMLLNNFMPHATVLIVLPLVSGSELFWAQASKCLLGLSKEYDLEKQVTVTW